MTFKIMARTILELGAELISSDGVALYELIKNAVDAGSRRVRIKVYVRVTHSQYDELRSLLDLDADRAKLIGQVRDAFRRPGLLDVDTAVVDDLLENLADESEDSADILRVWYEAWNWIDVIDRGDGMTMKDLREVYLTIGTRSRQSARRLLDRDDPKARAPLGEKGVGRLSTMRLGDKLRVTTTQAGDTHEAVLDIDWGLFSHDSDALLEDIELEPVQGAVKKDASRKGTTITIQGLKSDWSAEKVEAIAGAEFSKLVDPFEGSTANDLLRLEFNGKAVDVPEIDRRYLDLAHGTCKARYEIVQGRPTLHGSVEYKLRGKRLGFRLNASELVGITKASSVDLLEEVGSFDMEMWWYNRQLLKTVADLGTQREIRDEVKRWSGGLMLFRDGYRVNPYGGDGDDWLELDKKAFASKGFKLNRQQVVGRVSISWRNKELKDQTNREGLMDTMQKRIFVKILQHVLFTQFKEFIDREDKAARVADRTTFDNIEEKVETTEEEVRSRLKKIEALLPKEDRHLIDQALRLVKELTGYLGEAKALSDEVANDRAQLVHLAGVGLMVEFIMHELDRTTTATLDTLSDIDRTGLSRTTASAILTLGDQLKTINKRVGNLDPLSAARRQTKEIFDVGAVVRDIVEGHGGKIERHGIAIEGSFEDAGPWKVKAVRGMFIQIIENLLSNSFFWLIQESKIDPSFRPRITINVDPDDRTVALTDNGPGVDPILASEIFQPFVTRRPAGEGHGLGLYISREVAKYHDWNLDIERAPSVHSDRYNTFLLDMSAR